MPIKKNLTTSEKADNIMKMVLVGEFFKSHRAKSGKSLKEVADNLSLSPTYLSEIERGIKVPSDYLIRELAEFYHVNESEIFAILGRIPLSILEDYSEYEPLQNLFERISLDHNNLTDEKKLELYSRLLRAYQHIIDEEE